MTTLAELRAKLKAKEERSSGNNNGGGDRAVFAHWNQPEGSTSKVRYLWDGNDANPYFWVEKQMIRLPFAGIKGQFDSKPVAVQVPCMEMFGDGNTCPILTEVRPWFKGDNADQELGKKYWKKRQYIFHGFVRETQFKEEQLPENPIRKFLIGAQLFNPIKQALMDSEIEEIPTHPERGLDFNIIKSTKGGYADYSTSNWARRESALTNAELDAIEAYGVPSLNDYMPKQPSPADLQIIMEMFEASVGGEAYDPDRWAAFYKPPGLNTDQNSGSSTGTTHAMRQNTNTTQVRETRTETQVVDLDEDAVSGIDSHDEDEAPAARSEPAASGSPRKAEDILAMIRSRNAQK